MDEQDFWVRLEYRITAEFQGFADERLRRNWCDGLMAEECNFGGMKPSISGRAWCGTTGQDRWRFILVLPPGTDSYEQVDWSALLPSDRGDRMALAGSGGREHDR
ncbi:hypothetical protein AB0M36_01775 [Actinoplanes sp. NPDC051346]|uniref:hypothetical protein n=1 Tax=Actinoplanes sp. NPDC051346 TaxID=3155048 RepID=UPI00341E7745